jgi:phage shock protein C
MNDTPPRTPGDHRRLVRLREDRMVAGVCAGLAAHLGVDVTVVRLLAVLGAVLSFGTVALAYVVAWVLMPEL